MNGLSPINQSTNTIKACKSTGDALWLTPVMGVREAKLWKEYKFSLRDAKSFADLSAGAWSKAEFRKELSAQHSAKLSENLRETKRETKTTKS